MTGWIKTAIGLLCVCIVAGSFAAMAAGNTASQPETHTAARPGETEASAAPANPAAEASDRRPERPAAPALPATTTANTTHTANTAKELEALRAMERMAENETLVLYANRNTAEIAVKDKRDGYVWFSNPADRDEDPIASPLYKAESASQVIVSYYNEKGQINTMNSYAESVQKGQFTLEQTGAGLKVVYELGSAAAATSNVPQRISKERMEVAILNRIEDADVREDVAFKFRFNEEAQVYELRKLQDYVLEELSATLASIGYTAEDAAMDQGEGDGSAAAAEKPSFTVPLEYELDGEHLVVKVPLAELRYAETYPIAHLQLLKHFGAAGSSKTGYLFVPDGTGALIRLNNGRLNAEAFRRAVYGDDGTFDVKEAPRQSELVRLPVFGMKQNDHAFVGMIEDGDALAAVMADIGGRNDSYNTVGAQFKIVAMDHYTLTSGTKSSSVPMFERQPYQGDILIRYAFLSGDEADYAGMAVRYRERLAERYGLTRLEPGDAPFMLELVGAFPKEKSFLGIPYKSTESLTGYGEARQLLQELKAQGVGRIALRYVGWFNGGIRHDLPSRVRPIGALGGKSGLRELVNYAESNQVELYPDVALQQAYEKPGRPASFLNRKTAKIYKYDPVSGVQDKSAFSHYILSPSALFGLAERFAAAYDDYGIGGLSLRDLGSEVNSDFDTDHPVSRQDALQIAQQTAAMLRERTGKLMVSGGNAYSLPYAGMIVNAPDGSSGHNLTDETVPFYQIALHGYFELAGTPFNMSERQDPHYAALQALETGSNIYYQWMFSPSSAVKETPYNDLYALHYGDWIGEAAELYKEASEALKRVRHLVITDHRKLADNVTQTVFENGVSIIVNYNNTAVQVNGMKIDARSYRLDGEPS